MCPILTTGYGSFDKTVDWMGVGVGSCALTSDSVEGTGSVVGVGSRLSTEIETGSSIAGGEVGLREESGLGTATTSGCGVGVASLDRTISFDCGVAVSVIGFEVAAPSDVFADTSTACAAARADWAEEVGSTGSVVMIGRVDICDPEAGVSFKIACWVGATNRVLVAISVSQARFTTLSETKARNTNMARLFFMAISE